MFGQKSVDDVSQHSPFDEGRLRGLDLPLPLLAKEGNSPAAGFQPSVP